VERERFRAAVGALERPAVYSFDATELQRSQAIALQMMWRDGLGVEVEIQSLPARLLAQNKRGGDFQIARSSWVADYLDATTFLDVFRRDAPNNVTGWASARYDALLDEAAATADAAARADLLHRAERILIDEMPICPLYFYTIAYLQRPGLAGIHRNLLGRIDFTHAHWEANGSGF
jgi:oligopeptide transport system substrate-binding protein